MRGLRIFPMLSAEDLRTTVRFYTRLGAKEVFRFPETGAPQFVSLGFGETEIGIGQIGPKTLHGQPQRPATGHRVELCLYVDDVDEAVAELRADGTRVLLEPMDQPWGERVAYVQDPDGNLVMLTKSAQPAST
jgi:lactoylglutathione lyase